MTNKCTSCLKALGLTLLLILSATSCRTPKDITYFQDIQEGSRLEAVPTKEMVVRPGDAVSITVHSKDPQLAALFNLAVSQGRIMPPGASEGGSGATSSGSSSVSTYTVDNYGDIEFPVLGTLHIGGMKRTELAEYVKKELIDRNLVKDPTIIVEFYNRSVNVLGEVRSPGRVAIDRDRFTILDALAKSGDLTIQGKRTNVIVMREENGRQVAHTVDLTDTRALVASPVYYLQQNDVIYVEPSDVQKRNTTANGNSVFTPSFWISIASFATTLLLLIKNW